MRRKVQRAAAATSVAIAVAAALTSGAGATTGRRADFDLGLATHTPERTSALTLHVLYKADDPDAKPSPIRKVVIATPQGTRFHTDAVASCSASNDELMAEGSGACPAGSRIGTGRLTAISGFGPPADPVNGDLTLFNGGDAIIEVVTAPGTDRTLGIDRLRIDGSTLTGSPPTTPGGPPDGETAVRQIDFTIDAATRFVSTPSTCPASGAWMSTGTFGFADGAEESVASTTPCDAPAVPHATARLAILPHAAKVGRATRFVAQVRGAAARCATGATVRVGGRRAKTSASGRIALTVTVRRSGLHRATAKKPGCPTLTAAFRGG
jgi:hypothetical protein